MTIEHRHPAPDERRPPEERLREIREQCVRALAALQQKKEPS